MGLFDRFRDDRDVGYGFGGANRGFGGMDRGYDREMGGRGLEWRGAAGPRGGWSHAMSDYDRDMYRGSAGNRYDRDLGDRVRGFFGGHDRGYDRGMRGSAMGYDRDMGMQGRGYDRGMHRLETDTGDPFNDRANHTPIRVIRGEFQGGMRNRYDQGFSDRGQGWTGQGYSNQGRGYHGQGYDNPGQGPRQFGQTGGQGYSGVVGDDAYYGQGFQQGGFPHAGGNSLWNRNRNRYDTGF